MLESKQSRLCNANQDIITHIFSVEYWILTRTGTNIKFDTTMKILFACQLYTHYS